MSAGDAGRLLHGMAEADDVGERAGGEASLDFLDPRRVEAAAEASQPLQDRACRIGLHGVIDGRGGNGGANRAVVMLDAIDVQHQARSCRLLGTDETDDLGRHRQGPCVLRPPNQGGGRGCETVERTSVELPERLTSLRDLRGQRHVRGCVDGEIDGLILRRKARIFTPGARRACDGLAPGGDCGCRS